MDEPGTDGVGRGNQVNSFRTLKAILRDVYGKSVRGTRVHHLPAVTLFRRAARMQGR